MKGFRITVRLVVMQRSDTTLRDIRNEKKRDQGGPEEYVIEDQQLSWYTPRGGDHAIAGSTALIPGVLALVYERFGHPGVTRANVSYQEEVLLTNATKKPRDAKYIPTGVAVGRGLGALR